MQTERIAAHIGKRLAELDRGADMQDAVYKGRFSFGLDERSYGHLPAWKALAQQKKQMVKRTWALAFAVSLMVAGLASDVGERFAENWVKALVMLLVTTAIAALLYVIGSFHSVFVEFRKTEREVRRLLYQDILHELKKEEKEPA